MHLPYHNRSQLLRKCTVFASVIALALSWVIGLQPIAAEGIRPYVAVYEINPSTHAVQQISIHAPGSAAPSFTIPGGQYVTPNGRYVMAMPVLGAYSVTDLQTGTAIYNWPMSPGHMIPNSMAVSPNATYAGIASVSTVDNSWSITLFNLAANTQASFGDHIDPATGRGTSPYIPIQPKIEGWTGDEANLIVSTGIPNSDAPFRYFYKVPMSSLAFGPPAPSGPVPATVQLSPTSQITKLVFSPDSSKAAFGYGDPTNPPTHYTPASAGPGSPLPPNTLVMLDLNTNAVQLVARAGAGQGLSAPAWSPDGLQILFAGGDFSDSYFVGNPRLFSYSLPTAAISTGGPITTDPPHHGVSDMSVCSSAIFFRDIANAPDGTPYFGTIVSAPIGSLLTQSPIYGTPENALGPCVPMIGTPPATPPTVVSVATATYTPTPVPAGPVTYTCNLTPRLVVGGQGIVTPGNPNNLRAAPVAGSTRLAQIPPNGIFTVLSGPICDTSSGYYFWQVNYGGQVGYTAEGKDGVYYVNPYVAPANPPTALPTASSTPTPTATGILAPPIAMSPTDCIGYNPHTLTVVNKGALGYILTDGSSSLVLLDNLADANLAKMVFQQYTQQCFIGRSNHRSPRINYIMTYLQGSSGIVTVVPAPDCIPYNPVTLTLVSNPDGSVTLTSSSSSMQLLDNPSDGNLAVFIAKKYTQECFIGRNNARPNRRDYIVQYFR